jgi:hypothetical protein
VLAIEAELPADNEPELRGVCMSSAQPDPVFASVITYGPSCAASFARSALVGPATSEFCGGHYRGSYKARGITLSFAMQ